MREAGRNLRVLAAVMTLAATGAAQGHGNVRIDEDPCARRAGPYLVHYSVYEPGVDEKGQYCTEVPQASDAIVVLDLVSPELRHLPVSLRVVEPGDEDGLALAETPPRVYRQGVVASRVRFPAPGRYRIAVQIDGDQTYASGLPLYVDVINWPRLISTAVYWGVLLSLVTFVGMRVWRGLRRLWRRARADDVLL